MATWFTDSWSSLTGWTARLNGAAWSAATDLVSPTGTTNDWCALTQDAIDGDANRANIDALFVFRISDLSLRRYPIIVRASGADESPTHYAAAVSSGAIRIYYCNGSDAPTQVTSATAITTISVDTDFWIRFRCQGTALKIKIWQGAAGDEPGGVETDSGWNISVTDSTVTAAGWAGPSIYSTIGFTTYKQLGIGTNGDWGPASAPSAAVSPAFRRAFPRPILNF